jgi:uncharacterized RDD family membrane protein YckC
MSQISAAHPAAGPPVASDVRVADLDRRFYAFVVDRLIGWGIDATFAAVVGRVLWSQGHPALAVLAVLATVLAVGLGFALLLGVTGVSPGRALLGLRLVHTGTGEPIGVGPAVLRTAVLGLAAVPFGFGLAALAWTAVADTTGLRRGWHDHLVSSVELDAKPLPRSAAVSDPGPPPVVNLTTARLLPAPARDPGD